MMIDDVISKIWLSQSMQIYLNSNHAKFHPNMIWNELLLKSVPQEAEQEQKQNE